MPTVEIPTSELLRAAEQLTPSELEKFVSEVMTLRDKRIAPGPGMSEPELLEIIHHSLPEETQRRYALLRARRRDEILTPEEQPELLQITTQIEHMNVTRLQALRALAQLRKVSFDQLLDQLGIKAPPYE